VALCLHDRLKEKVNEEITAPFAYFNNDTAGNAVKDAVALRKLLGELIA
jgi:uncharacterized protein YecE (DUF72 family)